MHPAASAVNSKAWRYLGAALLCLVANSCSTGEGARGLRQAQPAAESPEIVATAGSVGEHSPAAPTVGATATAEVVATTEQTGDGSALETPGIEYNGIYSGLGAWLDVFDYSPRYSTSGRAATTPDVLDEMAQAGVRTLFLQTARRDDRDGGRVGFTEDPQLLAAYIDRAHEHDIAVVGWYLPVWEGPEETDLNHLVAILDFDVDGHQFDGVAVDIEGVPKPDERVEWNRRLVALSTALRVAADERQVDEIGAIVLPPVLLEEVNPAYWPDFPWAQIGPLYDVWLPMAYWSFRQPDSPWADADVYTAESIERLRRNVGDERAVVHAVGGIGLSDGSTVASEPVATVSDLDAFVQASESTEAVGWSIYDWLTISESGHQRMVELNG